MAGLKYWIWLADADVSPFSKAAVLRHYGDAERAFFAPDGELEKLEGVARADAQVLEERRITQAELILAECIRQGIEIICMDDDDYPTRLKNIYAPPPVLYVKGKLPVIDDNAVIAVVGTRRASSYGLKMAQTISGEIVQCGGIVISGLTAGIDAAAAQGALNAGGVCIGVLGTSHQEDAGSLSDKVLEKGAVISEYAPGVQWRRSFFRDRNRITAGLSVGVVAVEAPEKSGTRLFVAEAVEQGKEIFAVPGNADSAGSAGTIDMLRDGAKPVTCGWDVMNEFIWRFPDKLRQKGQGRKAAAKSSKSDGESVKNAPASREKTKKVIDKENGRGYIDLKAQLSGLNETQLKIISAIDSDNTHIDDIIESTGLGAATVLAQLTYLEIKGYVRREAGRRISLNTAKK